MAKVDTEVFPEEAARYGIRGIPNVKLFVDGKPVDEFTGALPETQVRSWLERALPSDSDRAARAALEEARTLVFDDPATALEILARLEPPPASQEETDDLRFLARLLIRRDDPGELPETAAGRHYLEGIRHLGNREFGEAVNAFIRSLREDRALHEEGARRACVAVFRHLGHDHSVVRRHRSDLASALYV